MDQFPYPENNHLGKIFSNFYKFFLFKTLDFFLHIISSKI